MPRLPTEDDLGYVQPRLSGRSEAPDLTADLRAQERAGAVLRSDAQGLKRFFDQEVDKLDELKAEEALVQLRQRRLDLTLGEKGFQSVKAGDVLKRPVIKEYGEQFQRGIDEIGRGLSGNALTKFKQRSQREVLGFQTDISGYVTRQVDLAKNENYKNSILSEAGAARQAVEKGQDPLVSLSIVGQALDRVTSAAARRADELGYTGDAMKATREQFMKESVGTVSETVVEALTKAGRTEDANLFLNGTKDRPGAREWMTEHQLDRVERPLKGKSDFVKGTSLGDQAFELARSGKSDVEVLDFLTKSAGDNKEVLGFARQQWTVKEQAFDRANDERAANAVAPFYEGPPTKAKLLEIEGSDAFIKLPKKQQITWRKDMQSTINMAESRAYTQEQRAYTREARISAQDVREFAQEQRDDYRKQFEPEAIATYGALMRDPVALANMPAEALLMYRPLVGRVVYADLEKARAHAQNEIKKQREDALKFKVDETLIKDGMPEDLINNPRRKDEAAAFRAVVTSETAAWKQRYPGKMPTLEEQKAIVREATKTYRDVDAYLFGTELPRYQVEARGLNAVPADVYPALRKGMAEKLGVDASKISSKQVLEEYRAARARGRTDADIMDALKNPLQRRMEEGNR